MYFASVFIRRLQLFQFKNHGQVQFDFEPGINCITGKNGAGKTNVLDAIHYACLTRSFLNPMDQQNIQHGSSFFRLDMDAERNELTESVRVIVQSGKKKSVQRNNNEYRKLSEHIGVFPLVIVSPADQALIYDGSEERRKLIDSILSQHNHEYLSQLIRYNRLLEQRNQLLKNFAENGFWDNDLIESYSVPLSVCGDYIYEKRREFVRDFEPIFQKNHQIISHASEQTSFEYESPLQHASMLELLNQNKQEDKILQRTGKGIHKDDFQFKINTYPLKKFGSQGQLKSFILALKLAELEYLELQTGQSPFLLLDDVFDKLDPVRIKQLFISIRQGKGPQVFITDTSKERLEKALKESACEQYRFFELH